LGWPALAANRVTVDWAMGVPAPNTWPLMSAAKVHVAKNKLEIMIAASIGLGTGDLHAMSFLLTHEYQSPILERSGWGHLVFSREQSHRQSLCSGLRVDSFN
jgi:hypothetical protein